VRGEEEREERGGADGWGQRVRKRGEEVRLNYAIKPKIQIKHVAQSQTFNIQTLAEFIIPLD
jgi:hypothetical protein